MLQSSSTAQGEELDLFSIGKNALIKNQQLTIKQGNQYLKFWQHTPSFSPHPYRN
jgi:hypothetical protein